MMKVVRMTSIKFPTLCNLSPPKRKITAKKSPPLKPTCTVLRPHNHKKSHKSLTMPFSRILQKILRKSKASLDHEDQSPPPYNHTEALSDDTIIRLTHTPRPKKKAHSIKATDVPQWKWTEAECREWYKLVFMTYLSISRFEAADLANSIDGWGPSIFSRSESQWIYILGEGRGIAMHTLIVSVRRNKGAVPRNVTFS